MQRGDQTHLTLQGQQLHDLFYCANNIHLEKSVTFSENCTVTKLLGTLPNLLQITKQYIVKRELQKRFCSLQVDKVIDT